MEKEFSCTVSMYQRNPLTFEQVKGTDGKPVVEREIGTFTFHVPKVRDTLEIAAVRSAIISRAGDPKFLSTDFFVLADAFAHLPRMVKQAPPAWDWENLYNEMTMLEIFFAYQEGLEEIRKKNPSVL